MIYNYMCNKLARYTKTLYTVKSYIIKYATMLAMLIYNHTKKCLLDFWLLT